MKVIKILSVLFSTIGLGLLVGSVFLYSNTTGFVARAATAEGKVIDLVRDRSSSGSSSTYRPVVEFTIPTGLRVEFTSGVGTSPPAYRVGEPVTVLYDPVDPNKARIKSFFSLWFGFMIVFALGLIFAILGLGMILVPARGRRRAEWLRRNGRRVKTAFKGVELNSSLHVNGRSPYRIISQASDAGDKTVRVYQSENIWFDPSEYIKNESIDVLVDPGNPKKYVMDIDFLPKLAE
jgi:hypothetical protein